ncbi:GroES-like protein [Xylariaceae sp. FL1272]|nr:GroES-like protein [Xylariaceae sp. FL1272]
MATGKAIVIEDKGVAAIKDLPLPKLDSDKLLVKVRAVGLNPTDWKSLHSPGTYAGSEKRIGSRLGCDYAGEVIEIGKDVKGNWKEGDRVSGWVFGAFERRPDNAAFGEYLVATEHVAMKTPDNVTDEEAATLGISVTTVGQGMYKSLKLPSPSNPSNTPFPILIYGGSTATGIYGIQYAKASGLSVIATSSPHNFELLKAVGADHVFDYKSPTVGADIRALTENKLKYAWDCTGLGGAISAAALSDNEEGGKPKYGAILPVERKTIDDVNPIVEGPLFTLGYDAFGVDYNRFGTPYEGKQEEVDFAREFWGLSQKLFEEGKLKPLKPEVNRGGKGLEGVLVGLEELRNDKVSGGKLVYTI